MNIHCPSPNLIPYYMSLNLWLICEQGRYFCRWNGKTRKWIKFLSFFRENIKKSTKMHLSISNRQCLTKDRIDNNLIECVSVCNWIQGHLNGCLNSFLKQINAPRWTFKGTAIYGFRILPFGFDWNVLAHRMTSSVHCMWNRD